MPYERFREVNEQAKRAQELERKLADIEARLQPKPETDPQLEAVNKQLKAMGYAPVQEVEALVEQKLKDQQAELSVKQEIQSLSQKYDGKNGLPKFDANEAFDYARQHGIGNLETAYKEMHEKALIDWHVKQALTKSQGVKTEGSDGSGSSQVGTTDQDLLESIKQGDRNALKTRLKRLL